MSFQSVTVVENRLAARSLHHLVVDFGDTGIADGYTVGGQFVQLAVGGGKPGFYAIASAPGGERRLEFLVKKDGATSAALCELWPGATISSSAVMGRGFPVADHPGRDLLIFATGSGISPIRALVEGGVAEGRGQVHLYYGCLDHSWMAYRERLDDWRARGVAVHTTFDHEPEGSDYSGPTGFVQDVYAAAPPDIDVREAAAVLCGLKGMVQATTALLTGQGMPADRVLLNF
jgi:NAD(P)H-flavin reductase